VRLRIGEFLPEHPDKWWGLTKTTESASLILELSNLILEKAVPFIKTHLDTSAVIALWESGRCPGITDTQRIRFLSRLKDKGKGANP
jgi:hypothetical protein